MPFRLFAGVALALLTPLLLGVFIDLAAGTAPWGLLGGFGIGIFLAILLVIQTISARLAAIAPPTTTEDSGETSIAKERH